MFPLQVPVEGTCEAVIIYTKPLMLSIKISVRIGISRSL